MKILVITPVNKFDYLAAAIIEGLRLSAGWEHIKHVENLKDINL